MIDVNRVLIDAAVDRCLRNVPREPRRSLRNLLDLGLLFAKTPVQKEFLQSVAQMLTRDDSAYFDLITEIVAGTDRDWLKNICVNVGYEACILGARAISQAEEREQILIPWSVRMCCGEGDLSPMAMEEIVWQSVQLGIHIFLLEDQGLDPESLRELMEQYPKCTFFILTSPERLRHWDLTEMGRCRNMAWLLDYDAPGLDTLLQQLRGQRAVYGLYRGYNDDNAQEQLAERALLDYGALGGVVFMLSAQAGTSDATREMVRRNTRALRLGQQFPVVLIDTEGDIGHIEQVISHRSFVLRFDGQGDAQTVDWPQEVPVANIHVTPLREILRRLTAWEGKEETHG